MAGLLARFLDAPVNQVSAPHVAADRGIAVRELKTTTRAAAVRRSAWRCASPATRASSSSPRGRSAPTGAHLTRWGDYELGAELTGHALVLFNENKPGVIGSIGTILGKRQINVARVQLGLNPKSNEAVSVWNVDSALGADALEEIKRAPNVQRALAIRLDELDRGRSSSTSSS